MRCGLRLQEEKTEPFSGRDLNQEELFGMKKAGVLLEDGFAPGFICYGIPVGSPRYVSHMLKERAEEIVKEAEEITEILCEDSQALWVVLHRSLAHKFDYHLSLSYPSDIRPVHPAQKLTKKNVPVTGARQFMSNHPLLL